MKRLYNLRYSTDSVSWNGFCSFVLLNTFFFFLGYPSPSYLEGFSRSPLGLDREFEQIMIEDETLDWRLMKIGFRTG